MPMLSDATRATLVDTGKQVYLQYLLLDMVTNPYYAVRDKSFTINGVQQTFQAYIGSLLDKSPGGVDTTMTMGDKTYSLSLKKQADGKWSVAIGDKASGPVEFKPISDYKGDALIALCQQCPLTVSRDDNKLVFSSTRTIQGRSMTIGGKNKIQLYQLHINNLYNMLQQMQDKSVDPHMLVAMATGSGKSFTQALWYLILNLADIPCVFSAPQDNLVQQLAKDFKRLLPDEVVADCCVDTPDTKSLPKWMIATHERVLTHYWSLLNGAGAGKDERFLCFDEQHDAAKEELYKKRIALLAKRYPSMFLSATPTKDAYAICGGRSVATLSRQEKEAMGIAKSPISHEVHAETLVGQKSRKHAKVSVFQRMILAFVNALEYERISPAHEYVDKCELAISFRDKKDAYYRAPPPRGASDDDIRAFIRWNIHCPIGDKALVLMSQHDTVVNYGLLSQGQKYDPYRQGNRVPRDNVYGFFQLPHVDDRLLSQYEQAKLAMRQQNMLACLQANFPDKSVGELEYVMSQQVDFSDEASYLKHRVLHGVIENTLMYLTGYDSQQLDQERFHNPKRLMALVQSKLATLADEDAINAWLVKEGIPVSIGKELMPCMRDIIIKMRDKNNESQNMRLIENWSLDAELHREFRWFHTDYMYKYKTVFLVNGLERSPSAIPSNHPFFKLDEEEKKLDSDEVRADPKLRHKYSTLEALDDTTTQRVYVPRDYSDGRQEELSAKTIDTLFRHGLIGSYVTSERVTGFNDPDLHHVAIVMDSYEDRLNEPAQIIQGSGRNRGLNPVKQPFFFLCTDDSAVSLSPSVLEKKDYYPDFFSATDAHRKKMAHNIGKNITIALKFWIESNVAPTGELESSALHAEIQRLVLDEFERIYNSNGHDFELAKAIFATVLEDVYKSLHVECELFKTSYGMPIAAKIIGHILNFITSLYYRLATLKSYGQFVKAVERIKPHDDETQNAALYGYIVRNYDYTQLVAAGIPAKRFKSLLDHVRKKAADALEARVLRNPMDYLKPEYIQSVDTLIKEQLAPSLLRFIGTTQQQVHLLKLINQQTHWIEQAIPLRDQLAAQNADTVVAFFDMLKTNPEIAAYIDAEGMTPDLQRMQNVQAQLMQAVMEIGVLLQSGGALTPELITPFTDRFQQLLYPKDAEFFAQHASEITPERIIALLQEGLPTQLNLQGMIGIVRRLLPAETLKAANDGHFLQEEFYADNAIKPLESDLAQVVKPDAVRHYLADSLTVYFESPFLSKFMDTVMKPFSDAQLGRLLDAIYPQEKAKVEGGERLINSEKVKILRSFGRDVKQLSTQELFKKYANFDQANEKSLNHTQLVQLFNWINDLYMEILHCQCHYHEMGEKGEVGDRISPKLQGDSKHEIWQKRSNVDRYSIIGAIAKKTKFITAARQSLDELSQVEELSTRQTATWMKTVAEHSVSEMMPFFKNKTPKKRQKTHTPAQTTLSEKAREIGEAVKKSTSMSEQTVQDAGTKHRSSIAQLRDSLAPKKEPPSPKK